MIENGVRSTCPSGTWTLRVNQGACHWNSTYLHAQSFLQARWTASEDDGPKPMRAQDTGFGVPPCELLCFQETAVVLPRSQDGFSASQGAPSSVLAPSSKARSP